MQKIIVITGASAGIGAAFAHLAAGRGHAVAISARRKEQLEAVARGCGQNALPVVADATRRSDTQRLFDETLARFGRVDVWVNNAGRGISRAVSELTDEDLDAMWTDNVKSALYGMQVALPHFKARNEGQIINVSSGLGRMPTVPFRSAYSAAKHALNALTACLRLELAGTHPGIVVSTVMPGPVATDFGNNALGGGIDSRKLPGAQTAEEVAAVLMRTIDERLADVYTAPQMQAEVERYYRDPIAAEREMAARFRR